MEKFAAFANKWDASRQEGVGCWLGDISDIQVTKRVTTIARKAGYRPSSNTDFYSIGQRTAARVLAYVQKESMAYGERRYREGLARDMAEMLEEMGPDALFWSNSRHSDFASDDPPDDSNAWMWIGLTDATFDTGVIACNDRVGFIYWREEDD